MNHQEKTLFSFCEAEYVRAVDRAVSIAYRTYDKRLLELARKVCGEASKYSEIAASILQPEKTDKFLQEVRAKIGLNNADLLSDNDLRTSMRDFLAFRRYVHEDSKMPFFRENEQLIQGYRIFQQISLLGKKAYEEKNSKTFYDFVKTLAKYQNDQKSFRGVARSTRNPLFIVLCNSLIGNQECINLLDEVEKTLFDNGFPSTDYIDWIKGRIKREQKKKTSADTEENYAKTYFPRTRDGATFNLFAYCGEFDNPEKCLDLKRRLEDDAKALREKQLIEDLQKKAKEQTFDDSTSQFRNLVYKASGRNVINELNSIETHEEACGLINDLWTVLAGHPKSYTIVSTYKAGINMQLIEAWKNGKNLREMEERTMQTEKRLSRFLPRKEYTFVAVRDIDGNVIGYEHMSELVKDKNNKIVHCEHADDLMKRSQEMLTPKTHISSKIEKDVSRIDYYFAEADSHPSVNITPK